MQVHAVVLVDVRIGKGLERLAGMGHHLAADIDGVDFAELFGQGARDSSGTAADLENAHIVRRFALTDIRQVGEDGLFDGAASRREEFFIAPAFLPRGDEIARILPGTPVPIGTHPGYEFAAWLRCAEGPFHGSKGRGRERQHRGRGPGARGQGDAPFGRTKCVVRAVNACDSAESRVAAFRVFGSSDIRTATPWPWPPAPVQASRVLGSSDICTATPWPLAPGPGLPASRVLGPSDIRTALPGPGPRPRSSGVSSVCTMGRSHGYSLAPGPRPLAPVFAPVFALPAPVFSSLPLRGRLPPRCTC